MQGNGIAVGGEGGSAGEDKVWSPPARSGYEIYMEKMGLPSDPLFKQFGRGGAVQGYTEKLQIIQQLRTEYFNIHLIKPESVLENINAVPLGYLIRN